MSRDTRIFDLTKKNINSPADTKYSEGFVSETLKSSELNYLLNTTTDNSQAEICDYEPIQIDLSKNNFDIVNTQTINGKTRTLRNLVFVISNRAPNIDTYKITLNANLEIGTKITIVNNYNLVCFLNFGSSNVAILNNSEFNIIKNTNAPANEYQKWRLIPNFWYSTIILNDLTNINYMLAYLNIYSMNDNKSVNYNTKPPSVSQGNPMTISCVLADNILAVLNDTVAYATITNSLRRNGSPDNDVDVGMTGGDGGENGEWTTGGNLLIRGTNISKGSDNRIEFNRDVGTIFGSIEVKYIMYGQNFNASTFK